MLNVLSPDEVLKLIEKSFDVSNKDYEASLSEAVGKVLCEDIIAKEYVPGFNRSSVDGYAVRAADCFGCTESIPAILELSGSVLMGEENVKPLKPMCCMQVPTGGMVPPNADAVVMVEHTEEYGPLEVAIYTAAAPGDNLVYKGDDCKPGDIILKKGKRLNSRDIGTLASLGYAKVKVKEPVICGVISTGDELVDICKEPAFGEVRDINSYMICALCEEWGCKTINYGIIKDNEDCIRAVLQRAVEECDMVIISAGSSVGQKDTTSKLIGELGTLLLHGIAMKPGKPTIIGSANGKPVIGLPGHPGAAYYTAYLFVTRIIERLLGSEPKNISVKATLMERISANQGRAVYVGVKLIEEDGELNAYPLQSKSGVVSVLSRSDGYICVARDAEGLEKGVTANVYLF